MQLKEIKRKIDKLANHLDLSKYRYFTKKVFRGVLVFAFIITFGALVSNNFNLRAEWFECVGETCINPCIPCGIFPSDKPCMVETPDMVALCGTYWDNETLLTNGDIIGNKPGFLMLHYNTIISIIVILGFLINHIIYIRGKNDKFNFKF